MKVVLDNNVCVSASISAEAAPAEVIRAWRSRSFLLITSEEIINELERVFSYPRVLRYRRWTAADVREFLSEIRQTATVVTPKERLKVIRDPADDMLLEAAITGGADYIVSGDRDLLDLRSYEGIEIVTPARFLAVLREAASR